MKIIQDISRTRYTGYSHVWTAYGSMEDTKTLPVDHNNHNNKFSYRNNSRESTLAYGINIWLDSRRVYTDICYIVYVCSMYISLILIVMSN